MPTLPHAARTAGRVFAWALAAVLLLTVLIAIWVGVRGAMAYQRLADAQTAAAGDRKSVV